MRLYTREDSIMSGRFTVTRRIFCKQKKRREVYDAGKEDDASKEIETIKMEVNTYLLLVGIRASLGPKYFRVLNHRGWRISVYGIVEKVQAPVLAGAGRRAATFRDLDLTMWYVGRISG